MHRVTTWLMLPVVLFALSETGQAQRGASAGGARGVTAWQSGLEADLHAMRSRLGDGRSGADQTVADSERLRERYRGMQPRAPEFGPDEYRRQGPLAQQSFAWLDGAYHKYRGYPPVARSLLGTYTAVGDFYGRAGLGSRAGFWLGYAGAHRAGRGLLLAGAENGAFERQLEALAVTWAGAAAVNWRVNEWLWNDWAASRQGGDRVIDQAVGTAPAPEPVPVPTVDAATLSPAGQAKWREVRERFATVSARAHQAQVALADLRGRLAQQGLSLHPNSLAASLAMQGFLEDSVDAIEDLEFDRALDALTRSDYERNRLRAATGQ